MRIVLKFLMVVLCLGAACTAAPTEALPEATPTQGVSQPSGPTLTAEVTEPPAGSPGPIASAAVEPTPTPEIFQPLDPSPTASGSDLPMTCQVTDLNVFIDQAAGFCFAYPANFNLGEQPSDKPSVQGPPHGAVHEPVRATFSVEISPVDPEKSLEEQATEFVRSFTVVDPESLPWQPVLVGGEHGLQVDQVPAMLSWRIAFVQHGESLFRLLYWPVDLPEVRADLDELYQVTLNTFAFID